MSFYAGFAGKFFKIMHEISISVKGTVGLFLKESRIIIRRKLFLNYSGRKDKVAVKIRMCNVQNVCIYMPKVLFAL